MNSQPKNILWLTWRDIKNPSSGGAEKVAIEIASRLVKNGAKVTIFTSRFKNSAGVEKIRGVSIVRKGNLITCRILAFFYFLKNRHFDIVIDEINTIPFFSFFYAKNKTFALVHQIAREYWFTNVAWPLNLIGFYLEPLYLRFYRNITTIAISTSTKNDLTRLSFEDIRVVRMGLDFKPRLLLKKQDSIIFIGRLIEAKNPSHAIKAFKIIHEKMPNMKLQIVGRGKAKNIKSLKKLVKDNKLTKNVIFKGFITDSQKLKLLKTAKIALIPSIREGWNLVASEASAMCCIPIGYNVPGLQDSIKNGITGLLVDTNPQALAQGTIHLLANDNLRIKMAKAGYELSRKLSWENCYLDFENIIFKSNKLPIRDKENRGILKKIL